MQSPTRSNLRPQYRSRGMVRCSDSSPGCRSNAATKSTVIKGKAPVAKELLHVRFPKPKTFTLSNGARVFRAGRTNRLPAFRAA